MSVCKIQKGRKRLTDREIFEASVFSSGDLCGHGSKVHGLLNDIAIARDQFWVYGFEEEGVIVLSEEASEPRVSSELDMAGNHFLICVMSFERTCLRGFSFTGRGEALWSKATAFRFLETFMGGDAGASLCMGE